MSLAKVMEMSCDSCGDTFVTTGPEATVAIICAKAKQRGWLAGYRQHHGDYCPECQPVGQALAAEVKS